MCHNSGVRRVQIDKCVEQGMPQRIVRAVQYTIRKRAEEHDRMSSAAACKCANESPLSLEAVATLAPSSSSSSLAGAETMANSERYVAATILQPEPKPTYSTSERKTCPFGRGLGLPKENIMPPTDAMNAQQKQHKQQIPHIADELYSDVLAVCTQWTKRLLLRLSHTVSHLQSTKSYTLLTKTTQPAHAIVICILSFILLTIWPEIFEHATIAKSIPKTERDGAYGHLTVIAYLGAFATHFGAQIWMTFVSGLSLYFALPRHTFGQCQQILFPKYFSLNAVLSIFMLILFMKFFMGDCTYSGCIQLCGLALKASIEVIVRLYLIPPMLLLMHEKYKIEDAVGSGQEIGGLLQGDLVNCPHYQRIQKRFRRFHGAVAIGNIVTLLCTCLHLYYLASKITFT